MDDPPKIIVDGDEEWSAMNNGDEGGYKQDVEDEEETKAKAANGPTAAQGDRPADAQKEP